MELWNQGTALAWLDLGRYVSTLELYSFYLESVSRASKSCTQIDCVWKEPRVVESIPYAEIADIPFEKPKSQISGCKRGAHLYSDIVPLADLQLVGRTEEVMSTEDNELPSTSSLFSTAVINKTSSLSPLPTTSCNETPSNVSLLPTVDAPSSSSSSGFMQLLRLDTLHCFPLI